MTTAAVLCGISLIVFVQPPSRTFGDGEDVTGDWRPTLLALAMLGLYVVILKVQAMRSFYELRVLTVPGYVFIAAVVLGWAYVLRAFWRINLPRQARRLWRYLTAD